MDGRKNPRILLAAPQSGTGKTMLTCGILRAMQRRNVPCVSFKCGPDYIDPMFHRNVLGIAGSNLDTFFADRDTVRAIVAKAAGNLAVMEGVMGYYDGLGGTELRASTYEVAEVTDTPVILIVDGKKCSLSVAALIQGFLAYQKNSHIQGVICNRMSPMLCQRLVPKIEELGVRVLGCVPELSDICLESRHLGLVMPNEIPEWKERLERLAEALETYVDLDGILQIAAEAPSLNIEEKEEKRTAKGEMPINIAVAMDEAFCFYYPENLECLKNAGAKLEFFSPLHDAGLPEQTDGVLLGGGYPELFAQRLSENVTMRQKLREAVCAGLPILAECGGFLYLHRELENAEGHAFPMAGVFGERGFKTGKLGRFGYITLTGRQNGLLKAGEQIRAHEFHYWESTQPGSSMRAEKPVGKRSWDCMVSSERMLAGFPHLYYPSNPKLPERFVAICRKYREERHGRETEEKVINGINTKIKK